MYKRQTQDDGDVKSNLLCRVLEIPEATKIIRQALDHLPDGKITNRSWEMQDAPITKSYIEVPRGKPVSYTHLDVYKRQISAFAGIIVGKLTFGRG